MTVLATLTLAATATGAARTPSEQIHKSTSVLRFFDNHRWLRAPEQPNCQTIPWTRSCRIARRVYKKHFEKVAAYERQYVIPATGDWRTAVRLAQRIYPGTESWMLYISHREGGYGPFVMNHQGSGAGGWMQFMHGTFISYAFGVGYGAGPGAKMDVAGRGFTVPPGTWDWYDPLGQALTAGYMRYTGRDECNWCL